MSTYRSRAADQRAADEVVAGQDLMCGADGCPHRWSVDNGSRLCSFHAWAPSNLWPRITQERLDAMADRALRAQRPAPEPRKLTFAEKMAGIRALREFELPKAGRTTWAREILSRADSGELVTPLILRMAKEVVGKLKARREVA